MFKITREQFFEFIKKKKDTPENLTAATQHYLKYFDQYQSTGKKGNWNWGGLVPIWFFYRRMYVGGLAVIFGSRLFDRLVEKALKISGATEDVGELMSLGAWILLVVILMRYADYMYLYYASDKISKGKVSSGVNKWAAIAMVALAIIALGGLISYLGFEGTLNRL